MTLQNTAEQPHAAPSLVTARLLVVAAAVMWSSSGFFAKAPIFEGWPGPVMAFWRAAFACVVLVPLVRRPQWSWKLVPMAAVFAAMNYSYLTAMMKGSAANAIWMQNTAPAWVLVVGVLVFRERAGWRDLVLLAFSGAGVGVILWYESQGESVEAVLWGLAAGATYAGIILSLRQLREFDSTWLATVNHSVTALALSALGLEALFGSATAKWPSGMQWPMLAAFGILQMGLPYVLFARGLKTIPGHEAAGIGLLEPILLPVWVVLCWGIRPDWWTLVGGGLILTGLVLRYLPICETRNSKHEARNKHE